MTSWFEEPGRRTHAPSPMRSSSLSYNGADGLPLIVRPPATNPFHRGLLIGLLVSLPLWLLLAGLLTFGWWVVTA